VIIRILRRCRERSPTSSGDGDPLGALLARRLLVEAREELTRADQKAQTLLAAVGIAAGALLAGLLAGSWAPFTLDNRIEWLWWIGVMVAAGAIIALGMAVRPRTYRDDGPEGLRYFRDVTVYPTRAALSTALRGGSSDLFLRDVDQLYLMARIVVMKYTWIERGMLLIAVAATCCTLSILVNLTF
jgi:MFS family permease